MPGCHCIRRASANRRAAVRIACRLSDRGKRRPISGQPAVRRLDAGLGPAARVARGERPAAATGAAQEQGGPVEAACEHRGGQRAQATDASSESGSPGKLAGLGQQHVHRLVALERGPFGPGEVLAVEAEGKAEAHRHGHLRAAGWRHAPRGARRPARRAVRAPIDGLAVEHAEVGQRGAADGGEQGPEDLQDAVHGAQGAHGVAGGGRGVRFGTGGEAEEAGVVEAISQRSTA
jgi:hypothetical protein